MNSHPWLSGFLEQVKLSKSRDWTITIEQILKYKDVFSKMAKITESDIREIFIHLRETKLETFKDLVYAYDAPLYQKMIFRLRNCEGSPSRFYHQIDYSNQDKFASYFGIYGNEFHVIMEFMAWIKNGLGLCDLEEIGDTPEQIDEYTKLWEKNELYFFFGVSDKWERELINRYNKLYGK